MRSRSTAWMLVALLLLALNLRLAVTSAASLLTLLIGSGALTPQAAVLVPALPTAMFALAGVITPWLSRRFGAGSAVTGALVALVTGLLVRIIPDPVAVVAGTVLCTAGIAVVNVLLPPLVRAVDGARVRGITIGYTTVMSLAAAVGAATAVPIAHTLGSPSLGIGAWTLTGVLSLVVWVVVARGIRLDAPSAQPASARRRRLPAGTWALTGFFALQALLSFVLMGWLPTIAADAGIEQGRAGVLLGIVMGVCIPAAILAVLFSGSVAGVRTGVLVVAVTSVGGLTGFWLAPTFAPELWAGLLGVGAAAFPLALALIARAGSSAADSARVSGFAQGVGYTIATVGPLGAGAWRGAGGDWDAVLVALIVGAVTQGVIGLALVRRPRPGGEPLPTTPVRTPASGAMQGAAAEVGRPPASRTADTPT